MCIRDRHGIEGIGVFFRGDAAVGVEMGALAQGVYACVGAAGPEQLAQIYSFLRAEIENTAGKLMESLTNTKGSGLERMQCMQQALRGTILNCIRQEMCIRDRSRETCRSHCRLSFKILSKAAQRITAVSYTHLDVYKRQVV